MKTVVIIGIIAAIAYFGYTNFVKDNGSVPEYGTQERPFDWSTTENQIGTAAYLPSEGTSVYVKTRSGVRLAKKGEITWVKKQAGTGQIKTTMVPSERSLHTIPNLTSGGFNLYHTRQFLDYYGQNMTSIKIPSARARSIMNETVKEVARLWDYGDYKSDSIDGDRMVDCDDYAFETVKRLREKGLTARVFGTKGHSFSGILEGNTWYVFEPQIGESMINKGRPDIYSQKWKYNGHIYSSDPSNRTLAANCIHVFDY